VALYRVPLTVFGVGDRAVVTVAGRDLVLFRVDDAVSAFANACPHQGNPLSDGEVRGHRLRCVYHLWEFDLETGACLFGEASAETYPARVESDEVVIEVEP
jgi:nitrite reductase/ring-hydroxylating ferredoxin subunit